MNSPTPEIPASMTRIEAGYDVCEILDKIGLCPDVCAWVYDREGDYWWYLVATPILDTMGPEWIQKRLLKAFKAVSLPPDVTPLDIYLMSPNEYHVSIMADKYTFQSKGTPPSFGFTQIVDIEVDDVRFDKIVAYRIRKKRNKSNQAIATNFDRTVAKLRIS